MTHANCARDAAGTERSLGRNTPSGAPSPALMLVELATGSTRTPPGAGDLYGVTSGSNRRASPLRRLAPAPAAAPAPVAPKPPVEPSDDSDAEAPKEPAAVPRNDRAPIGSAPKSICGRHDSLPGAGAGAGAPSPAGEEGGYAVGLPCGKGGGRGGEVLDTHTHTHTHTHH